MDLREFRVVVRIVNRVAKRALFAEEQMVAREGQWKRIAAVRLLYQLGLS